MRGVQTGFHCTANGNNTRASQLSAIALTLSPHIKHQQCLECVRCWNIRQSRENSAHTKCDWFFKAHRLTFESHGLKLASACTKLFHPSPLCSSARNFISPSACTYFRVYAWNNPILRQNAAARWLSTSAALVCYECVGFTAVVGDVCMLWVRERWLCEWARPGLAAGWN